MIVFCPNCGTQNAGVAGARATCTACNSVFDVPGDAAPRRTEPPPLVATPPGERPPVAPPPQPFIQIAPTPKARGGTNTLAILSLVSGLVCCVPFVSPIVAVVCGVSAIRQLDQNRDGQTGRALAISGIVLGAIGGVLHVFWLIGTLARRF